MTYHIDQNKLLFRKKMYTSDNRILVEEMITLKLILNMNSRYNRC